LVVLYFIVFSRFTHHGLSARRVADGIPSGGGLREAETHGKPEWRIVILR